MKIKTFPASALLWLVCLAPWAQAADGQAEPDRAPAWLVRSSHLDLGVQDGSDLVKGSITVTNNDHVTHRILPRNSKNVGRLQFSYPAELSIAPGASATVEWRYDLHGVDAGPVQVKVELDTDDPVKLKPGYTVRMLYQPASQVKPYRSALLANIGPDQQMTAQDPLAFAFRAASPSDKFIDVRVNDRDAPLQILDASTGEDGVLHGRVGLDLRALEKGAPHQGETRIIAKTVSGAQSYILLQWAVLETQP